MIEARLEDRGRAAIILRCAQHHDGVGLGALVQAGDDQDDREGEEVEAANSDRDRREPESRRGLQKGNDSPSRGTITSRTPSSRRIVTIIATARSSPLTTKARLIGPLSACTHDRISSPPA